MTDTTFPYGNPGVAGYELTGNYLNSVLLRGSDPELSPAVSAAVGAANLARFAVVGFDATGKLALAKKDGTVKAIGVLTAAATAGATTAQYWYAGHFNSDMLVFDASFATAADKAAAFAGAPSPTRIRVSPRNA